MDENQNARDKKHEKQKARVQAALLSSILSKHFDMVAYLTCESPTDAHEALAGDEWNYGVVIGETNNDTAQVSIFPTKTVGNYNEYLFGRVAPALYGDAEQKRAYLSALSLPTVAQNARPNDPYVVNIVCGTADCLRHKRFAFYFVAEDFYILLKSDTTEISRQQSEQNNRLREALNTAQQASVAKTTFLSRMSHEIRTPMNAIIGLTSISLHEANLTPKLEDYLGKIDESARYLLALINDILDMSRIESGRVTVKYEEFSLRMLLDQIKTIVDGQCKDKDLRFRLKVIGETREYYIGDDTKLKQILINILGNAVKFTGEGGDITLTVECVARYDGQSSFRFVVKDTGIGMDKAYLPRIFEPFSQEDDTNTTSYGGSGVGLAITRNIVQMLNGSITAESAKGVGSTFTINIPLKDSQKDEDDAAEIRPQDISVLIVDDEAVACSHAKSVLDDAGIVADTATSGQEGLNLIRLKRARRDDYRVILVDLKMPDHDGIEVTREIRKIVGDEATVIILTVHDWYDVEKEAHTAGVDSFMSKPLSAANLLYELKHILRRKKPQNEPPVLADLEGRRILVAEDMPVNAEIVKQLLFMRGMEVTIAENGMRAVELFSLKPAGYFDAVLMDVRMPVLDGLGASRAIRDTEKQRGDKVSIPIIAMTANAFDEDVQRSLQAGMDAHLAKPVEPKNMYRTMAELIGKRQTEAIT